MADNDDKFYSVSKPWFSRRNIYWGLERDAFADAENAVLPLFWTAEDDAMSYDWSNEKLWIHPPYDDSGLITSIIERMLVNPPARAVMLAPLGACLDYYKEMAVAPHVRMMLANDLDPFVCEGEPDVWGHTFGPLVFVFCNIIARGM